MPAEDKIEVAERNSSFEAAIETFLDQEFPIDGPYEFDRREQRTRVRYWIRSISPSDPREARRFLNSLRSRKAVVQFLTILIFLPAALFGIGIVLTGFERGFWLGCGATIATVASLTLIGFAWSFFCSFLSPLHKLKRI